MSRERLRAFLPFAALAVVAAILTAWLLASERIPRSADQAVVALMARHVLEGRGHPVFYWGSTYGGTLEPHLLVPLFALLGATQAVFRALYLSFWAAFAFGTAGLTLRFFGRTAALAAAAFLAVPPFFLPYKILTSDGAYASVALLGLVVLFLALEVDARLAEGRPVAGILGALGLAAGLGVWVTPVTLPVSAVACAWLLLRRGPRPGVAAFALMTGAALVGAAPSLVWNLRHAGGSLRAPELTPAAGARLLANLEGMFSVSLPVFLGAARPHFTPNSPTSFPGAPVVVPVLAAALLLPALVAARSDRRLRLLFAVLAALSVAAVLSRRLDPSEPRYLVSAYAALAPLLGVGVARAAAPGGAFRAAALGGLAVLLASNLSGAARARRHLSDADDAQVTGPLEELEAALRRLGVARVYANYWTSYRLAFETREEILATPLGAEDVVRIPTYAAAVKAAPDAAVVLLPPRTDCFAAWLDEHGAPAVRTRTGAFTIFSSLSADVLATIAEGESLPLPRSAERASWRLLSVSRAPDGSAMTVDAELRNDGPCLFTHAVSIVMSSAPASGSWSADVDTHLPNARVEPGETVRVRVAVPRAASPGARVRLRLRHRATGLFPDEGATLFVEAGGESVNPGRLEEDGRVRGRAGAAAAAGAAAR